MTRAKRVIWLAGPFPPPLHGQAVYNAAIAAHLEQHGELRVLATGEAFLSKLAGYGRVLLTALFRMRREDVVYTSMPGQMAAWLFAAVVVALRLRGIRHFVHHHSFRSIVLGPLPAMRAVVALGGRGQHHILLSPAMRDGFAELYLPRDAASRAHALSNALLFCPATPVVPPRLPRPATMGHMSVLSREKGVDTVLALFRALAPARPDLRLVIAGPVADDTLSLEIRTAMAQFPGRIEDRGPVSGAAKAAFYRDIDLFLLPTRLVDEAEPLVMLESYAAGVEFMGSDRGCIAERIRHPDRLLTGDAVTDAARVQAALEEGAVDPEATRRDCGRHAARLHAQALVGADALFGIMLAPPPASPGPLRKGEPADTRRAHDQDAFP